MTEDALTLIKFLKTWGLYPKSGYGSIIINLQGHKIVNCEKKESIKLPLDMTMDNMVMD
ncbi:MAG: hypothetical protein AABY40_02705 [Nanoarchaeota archaeon]